MQLLSAFSVLLSIVVSHAVNLGCRINGREVDWFVAYKPVGTADLIWFIEPTAANAFAVGTFNTLETSPLKATIDAYMTKANKEIPNSANMAAVAYSDFPPYLTKPLPTSKAKGVVLMADGLNSWIVHTLPQFPDMELAELKYTPPDSKTGIALCLTMRFYVGRIFQLLRHAEAFKYYENVDVYAPPPAWKYRSTKVYLNGIGPTQTPFVLVHSGITIHGVLFTGFARYNLSTVDLFSQFIARILNVPLKVRFDTSQQDVLPNYCVGTTPTSNIRGTVTVSVPTEERGTVQQNPIQAKDDGSVWAVDGSRFNKFCVGDGPRTEAQNEVGSLIVCVTETRIHTLFNAIARTSNSFLCPGTRR